MNAPPPNQPPPSPYGRPPQPPPPTTGGQPETGRAYRYQAPWGRGEVRWQSWTWAAPSRPVPWLGAIVLALGIGLLVEQLVPELSFWSLVILALGGVFAAVWLLRGVIGATVPALVLLGWGLAGIGSELGYLPGQGWTALFVGLALLLAWAIGRFQGARRDWALVLGAILGLIGIADASDSLPFDVDAAIIIPVALIAAGIWLMWRRGLSAV